MIFEIKRSYSSNSLNTQNQNLLKKPKPLLYFLFPSIQPTWSKHWPFQNLEMKQGLKGPNLLSLFSFTDWKKKKESHTYSLPQENTEFKTTLTTFNTSAG